MIEESIFHAALERTDPADRAAYLDESCGGDADLRRRVEELLRAHDQSGGLLGDETEAFALPIGLPALAPDGPRSGDRVGPYTLLERIGEGGMGVVYRAEQERPVRRRVALKVIKPGLDTAQVVARFEAERQALALMDHPHIARVIDAGATDAGRPYFVMELVEGVPITAYCDAHRLPPRARLELLLPVCAAIQHAHQKGLIHRDLKPSNVLVAEVDGRPVPKVIDFGVAKATDPRLSGRTLLTQQGAIVGTPEYMSPEQAGAAPDVDTRTDVYGLGVLLYELLTGSTPLDRGSLRRAAIDEVLRQVRESEPPKPSTRLSGSGDRLPSVAAVRGTEPARLTRLVRGDLDWIVMKALEKDRSRRYATPEALARDVRRFLDGDPVEAGPPSRAYRLRKFARKHRAALAMSGAFAVVLVVATAISAWQAVRATRAEGLAEARLLLTKKAQAATQAALAQSEQARTQADSARTQAEEARAQADAVVTFLIAAFRSPDPSQNGRELRLADLLDRAIQMLDEEFTGTPAAKGALLNAVGQTYSGLGLHDRALEVYAKAGSVREKALGPEHHDTLQSRNNQAAALQSVGRTAEAIALHEATRARMEASLGPDHPGTLSCSDNLATAYREAGRIDEAIALHKATLERKRMALGPDHIETLINEHNLGIDYLKAGRVAEATQVHKDTLGRMERVLGPDHPNTIACRTGLGVDYGTAGDFARAAALHEGLLALSERKLGPDHPLTRTVRANLARDYDELGSHTRAEPLHRDALRRALASFGPGDVRTAQVLANLGLNLLNQEKWAEAASVLRDCLAVRQRLQPDAWSTFNVRSLLGGALLGQGRPAEAEPFIVTGYEGLKAREATIPPQGRPRLAEAADRVIALYEAWGRPEEAAAWRSRLGRAPAELPANVFARP